MSVNALAFVFGAFLVLTAILGGGFEIKEIKVPKVGWLPRILATVCGLAFVGVGIGMSTQSKAQATVSPAQVPKAKPQVKQATISIYDVDRDYLGQVWETVSLTIDGKDYGQINVDSANQYASMKVTLTPGMHSYQLESKGKFTSFADGSLYDDGGDGSGQIDVRQGKSFVIHETAKSLDMSLQEFNPDKPSSSM